MYGSLALPELLLILFLSVLFVVVPVWRILRRIGYSPLLALLALIPPFGIILLWYIAYSRWPRLEQSP